MLPNNKFWPKVKKLFHQELKFGCDRSSTVHKYYISLLSTKNCIWINVTSHKISQISLINKILGSRSARVFPWIIERHIKRNSHLHPQRMKHHFWNTDFYALVTQGAQKTSLGIFITFSYSKYLAMDDSQIIHNSNTFPETICLTILTEWIWRGKKICLQANCKHKRWLHSFN